MFDKIFTWSLILYILFNMEVTHGEEFNAYKVSEKDLKEIIIPVSVLAEHCDLGLNREELKKYIENTVDWEDEVILADLTTLFEYVNLWAMTYKNEDTCISVEEEYPEFLLHQR